MAMLAALQGGLLLAQIEGFCQVMDGRWQRARGFRQPVSPRDRDCLLPAGHLELAVDAAGLRLHRVRRDVLLTGNSLVVSEPSFPLAWRLSCSAWGLAVMPSGGRSLGTEVS